MGRKKLPIEVKMETRRIRNARNYAKMKQAREFYENHLKKQSEENKQNCK